MYFIPYGYNTILKTNTKGNMDAHILQEYDGLEGVGVNNAALGSEGLITLFNIGGGGKKYENKWYWHAINYTYKGVNKVFHVDGFLYGVCEKEGKLYIAYKHNTESDGYLSVLDMETNKIEETFYTHQPDLINSTHLKWDDNLFQSENCVYCVNSHIEFVAGEKGEDGYFRLSSVVTAFNIRTKEFKKFHFPIAGEVMQEDAPQLAYVHNNQLHVITREDYHYIFDED